MISIIRLQSQENREKIWDNFLANLDRLKDDIKGKGQLLYLSQRARHQDISLFVHASDSDAFGDFIAKKLCNIKDITSLWTIHLMKPLFFPLPKDTKGLTRFTITAKVFPSRLLEVYENLVKQSAHNEIKMAYIAFTFHLFEESLMFSLLAEEENTLERHIRDEVNGMPGILRTSVHRISKTKPLISYDEWKQYATRHSLVPSWDVSYMIENFQI